MGKIAHRFSAAASLALSFGNPGHWLDHSPLRVGHRLLGLGAGAQVPAYSGKLGDDRLLSLRNQSVSLSFGVLSAQLTYPLIATDDRNRSPVLHRERVIQRFSHGKHHIDLLVVKLPYGEGCGLR